MPLDGVTKKAPSAPPAPKPQPTPEPKKFNINKDSPIAGAENEQNQKKDSGNINAPKKEGGTSGKKKSGDQRGEGSQNYSDTPEYGRSFQDEYNTQPDGKPGIRERTENFIKNLPEKLQQSGGNPRALVGEASDEILNTGEKLGFALFLVWGAVFILTSVPFVFTGLPALFIWNMLMVSPKLVYRLTEFILDFVGVGEALQTADEFGITNVDIKLKTWHKLVIVFCDAVYFYIIFLIIVALVASVCYSINGPSNTERAIIAIVSPVSGIANDAARLVVPKEIKDFCSSFMGSLNSTIGGNVGGSGGGNGGPIVASGCSNKESGGCTRANLSICPEFASQPDNALRACNQESLGGRVGIGSTTDKCETPDGRVVSFSWGLWQINVTDSSQPEFPECAGVLHKVGGPWNSLCLSGTCGRTCAYGAGGQAAFDACVQALSDPVRNTRQACNLYNQRTSGGGIRGWRPWPHTRRVCGLP